MIHSKFSATLDRHMLKPVVNHQDYYFYDLIDDLVSYFFVFDCCYEWMRMFTIINNILF